MRNTLLSLSAALPHMQVMPSPRGMASPVPTEAGPVLHVARETCYGRSYLTLAGDDDDPYELTDQESLDLARLLIERVRNH